MTKIVSKLAPLGVILGIAGAMSGCAYGDIVASGDKAVVFRQDMFLFGALRKAFVCKITDAGLSDCKNNESP